MFIRIPQYFPDLVVAKNPKTDDEFYLVNDEKEFLQAVFDILKTWDVFNRFWEPSEPKVSESDQEVLDMDPAVVAALPSELKKKIRKIAEKANQERKDYFAAKSDFDLVKKFLKDKDPAATVTYTRRDGSTYSRYMALHLIDAYESDAFRAYSQDFRTFS